MSLIENFMMARSITFKDGSISLFSNRIVMAPATFFFEFTKAIEDSPKETRSLYGSAKASFKEIVSKDVRTYKFSVNDYIKWLFNIAIFSGWGILTLDSLDKEKMTGIITMNNSPISEGLKGQAKLPCDHIVRGFIAGAMSIAFKQDIDVVETECVALGSAKCKFVFRLASEFKQGEVK
ncbi:MAG: 4-vinyl reductase [Candidatus Micrarchaeota archaeon]|nr:4-vinyl reductase [Candidatus Micrarchaeota archaeon]